MYFGKLVKGVAHSSGLSAQDVANLLGRTEREVLELYEQDEWTSGNIKSVSVAMEYDFGKFLNYSHELSFLNPEPDSRELLLTIKYARGKEFLLKTWLQKISLIAKYIGLEISK